MPASRIYLWHTAPALKLLVPLVTGIISQWYLQFSITFIYAALFVMLLLFILTHVLLPALHFRLRPVQGIFLNSMVLCTGMLVVHHNDIRNHPLWLGNNYQSGDQLLVVLEEPTTEKPRSYKAIASIRSNTRGRMRTDAQGKLIIYFKKEVAAKDLAYGQQLVITATATEIRNAGNPETFDYRRYQLFEGVTHQVYLTAKDYQLVPGKKGTAWRTWLIRCRLWVVSVLQKNIRSEKESGLAEALLIGYKDNLDKQLVQSYANTGVVHVIAISGLHLGLIYGILLLLTRALRKKGWLLLRALLIIGGLWTFSFLAGAQPSVLRSAVMFTAIAAAAVLQRKTSLYNTLALSAFTLLCYHPFWLWDLGFQLSYSAVLSIIVFFKPFYRWLYFPNKAVDALWKLVAVTMAAQVLTTPISLFHFHQFPLLFIITNVIAVPLSSVILIGEILLCSLSFFPAAAQTLGTIIEHLIRFMNQYIERMEQNPLALLEGISVSLLQALLLYVLIAAVAYWFLEKKKQVAWLAVTALFIIVSLRAFSFLNASQQKLMVVYNIPKTNAVELIEGRNSLFLGDHNALRDESLFNFHIKPGRIKLRLQSIRYRSLKAFSFQGKKIVRVSQNIRSARKTGCHIDILIVSGSPYIDFSSLQQTFSIGQVVIDGSVPYRKAQLWQQQCKKLGIPCYNTTGKGAFVIKFQTPTFAAS